MAPLKKMTQKEIGLQERPWINRTILAAMFEREIYIKIFSKNQIPFYELKSTSFIRRKEIWLRPN